MLVLTRKANEEIRIGQDITVRVLKVGDRIKLGVEAPRDVEVWRGELAARTTQGEE